jgi:MFS transporter, ACS family, solute carrier family 17 (sodium-dependent inorganic phosphate cotransporter), other
VLGCADTTAPQQRFGLVLQAFFYGYALTQIPAGWISTKVGGARVLLAGVAIWSVGTLLAPPAAKMGEHPTWRSWPGPAHYPTPSLRPKESGTMLRPMCTGILALSATRVLVGLGEGFAPSAATNVLARLVPE